MDQVGLSKAKDLFAYVSNANTIEMKKIDRVAEKVLKTTGVRVRPINMKDFQTRCGARLGSLQTRRGSATGDSSR